MHEGVVINRAVVYFGLMQSGLDYNMLSLHLINRDWPKHYWLLCRVRSFETCMLQKPLKAEVEKFLQIILNWVVMKVALSS